MEIPCVPLTRLLDDAVTRFPNRTALIFFGRRIRYAELQRQVDLFADALRRLGVRPGDRVAIVLPNCPQMVISFFAVLRLGAIAVPHDPLYTRDEMHDQLVDCGATIAVVLDRAYKTVRAVRRRAGLKAVVVTSLLDYLPRVRRLALDLPFTRAQRLRAELAAPVPRDRGLYDFVKLLETSRPGARQLRIDPERDLAAILYTGGMESHPKGVMLTHRNLMANPCQSRVSDFEGKDGTDVALAVLPFFHSFGLTFALNVPLALASTIVLLPRFDPGMVADAFRRYRPTIFPGVPPMYDQLIDAPRVRDRHLKRLRICLSGAMPLTRATVDRFRRRTPALMIQGYGLTEAGPGAICNPLDGNARHVSVGMPMPSTDALVVDEADPTRPLPPGHAGELLIRGPQVFQGYWNRPEETAEILSKGWLRTGDVAVMSPDGFFTIIERQRDVIKVTGFTVFPVEVEEILCRHPAVMEAAVFGLPDEARGERVAACVLVHPSYPFSAEEMRRHCAKYLTEYKVPHDVFTRDDLPRSPLGKVIRRVLRQEYSGTGLSHLPD